MILYHGWSDPALSAFGSIRYYEDVEARDRDARKIANGTVTERRPLCPYPQRAEYRGSGSTDDEAHFLCR